MKSIVSTGCYPVDTINKNKDFYECHSTSEVVVPCDVSSQVPITGSNNGGNGCLSVYLHILLLDRQAFPSSLMFF